MPENQDVYKFTQKFPLYLSSEGVEEIFMKNLKNLRFFKNIASRIYRTFKQNKQYSNTSCIFELYLGVVALREVWIFLLDFRLIATTIDNAITDYFCRRMSPTRAAPLHH